jgi:hypothetical protein
MKKNNSVARFKSSDTIYTPHGLGIAYSNANLTDKAARYIIENDPDAAGLFSELPPAAEDDEDEQQLTPAQQIADKALNLAENPKQSVPDGFDYAKLAKAMVDELEQRAKHRDAQSEQDSGDEDDDDTTEQPPLTASTGGAADDQGTDNTDNSDSKSDASDSDSHDETKPASLSRANKEQLQAYYHAELGQEPAAELTNDDLRNAIAEKRASVQDPE